MKSSVEQPKCRSTSSVIELVGDRFKAVGSPGNLSTYKKLRSKIQFSKNTSRHKFSACQISAMFYDTLVDFGRANICRWTDKEEEKEGEIVICGC